MLVDATVLEAAEELDIIAEEVVDAADVEFETPGRVTPA